MSQTGAQKGCCGKFSLGVAGSDAFGGCFGSCCKTCPPDCCDTVYQYWECGDPVADCCQPETFAPETPTPIPAAKIFPIREDKLAYTIKGEPMASLPSFNKDEEGIMVQGFQFGPGSCPCNNVTVTISTSYCCFVVSGNSMTHVGNGTVTATPSPSFIDGCGDIIVKINGQPSPYSASDGEGISISVTAANGECNCGCCLVSTEDPCAAMYPSMVATLRKMDRGGLKLEVDTNEVIRKYNLLRKRQIANTIRKIRASRRNK